MKQILSCCLILYVLLQTAFAQIVLVKKVVQEQDQWCWAGVSSCILDAYGIPTSQCTIAEYTRGVASWHSFGTANCCSNPNVGCNYPNYNWGYPGSIQDILVHFGGINNSGKGGSLTFAEAQTQINNRRPFIVRWSLTSGSGHFVVGYGISGSNILYMNPWPGEGFKMATQSWMANDGTHTWTHTNLLSVSAPSNMNKPVPVSGTDTVCVNKNATYSVELYTNATYSWNVNGVWSSQTTPTITTSFGTTGLKTVNVRYRIGNDSSDAYTFTTYVKGLPAKPILGWSQDSVCLGKTALFRVTAVNGVKFKWYLNGQQLSDSTANINLLPTQSGAQLLKVVPVDECGTGTDSLMLGTYVIPPPPKPTVVYNAALNQLECSIEGRQYAWFRNQLPLSDSTKSIDADEKGAYQVKYFSTSMLCESPLSDNYTYIPAGLAESETFTYSVYPNPCNDVLYIEGPVSSLTLFDITGKVVLRETSAAINTSHLNAGMYFIKKQSTNGGEAVQKIIVLH